MSRAALLILARGAVAFGHGCGAGGFWAPDRLGMGFGRGRAVWARAGDGGRCVDGTMGMGLGTRLVARQGVVQPSGAAVLRRAAQGAPVGRTCDDRSGPAGCVVHLWSMHYSCIHS